MDALYVGNLCTCLATAAACYSECLCIYQSIKIRFRGFAAAKFGFHHYCICSVSVMHLSLPRTS